MTTTKKSILLGLLIVLGLAASAGGLWMYATETQINLPRTGDEAVRVMATEPYKQLPEYRKEAYRKEARRLIEALPEDQRRSFFQRAFSDAGTQRGLEQLRFDPMQKMMDGFFTKPPKERTAALDAIIDQMELFAKMGMHGPRAGTAAGSRPAGAGVPAGSTPPPPMTHAMLPPVQNPASRQRVVQHIESQIQQGDPREAAKRMEFFKAIEQRRKERGLPDRF